jgi:LacI family transcriptional regulator, galactose operon repressor
MSDTSQPRGGRRATMRDVAAAAGVDVSTVSKVLNGGSISVRAATRERIEKAATELRYRPDATARSLRLARTGAIGMLVPDFTNAVWSGIVRSAVREAEAQRRVVLIAEMDQDTSPEGYLHLVHERRIDGLLVATARDQSSLVAELEHDSVPHVFVNRRGGPDSLSVLVDDEAGAVLGTQALIDAGHTRLALLSGPRDIDTSRRRLEGFERTCAAAGLADPHIAFGAYSAPGGHRAAEELLAAPGPRPTGVLAGNLMMALGALSAFATAGIRVPEDMSMVAYDDAELAGFSRPALTTVAMPHQEMGSIAVRLLEQVLAGDPAESIVVPTPPRLIERDSVAPPAA